MGDLGRRARGFTLIELLAVTLIIALLAGIALPNFQLRSGRAVEEEAKQLAAGLEFARQRAVATGIPHRVVLDTEERAYWLEWFVSEARASGEPEELFPTPDAEPGPDDPIPMAPPRAMGVAFRAVPGPVGQIHLLADPVGFAGIDTPSGFVERGRVEIAFERDGTADPTEILLGDPDGSAFALSVAPLADVIRIRRETL